MHYVVSCNRCKNQGLIEIEEGDRLHCPFCPAQADQVEVIAPVSEVMPSPDEIAEAFNLSF